jgi:hypothetical protein
MEEVHRIAETFRLRRIPRVLVTKGQIPPVLLGIGKRSCMVLPLGLLEKLDQTQRGTLLAHELAHLRRHDHWIRWLEFFTFAIYWWHPVAWWARSRIQQAEEECCDGWVLWAFPDEVRAYARTLVETVEYLADSSVGKPAVATAFNQGDLFKRRIAMVLRSNIHLRLSSRMRVAFLVFAAVVLPVALSAEHATVQQPLRHFASAREVDPISVVGLPSKSEWDTGVDVGTAPAAAEANDHGMGRRGKGVTVTIEDLVFDCTNSPELIEEWNRIREFSQEFKRAAGSPELLKEFRRKFLSWNRKKEYAFAMRLKNAAKREDIFQGVYFIAGVERVMQVTNLNGKRFKVFIVPKAKKADGTVVLELGVSYEGGSNWSKERSFKPGKPQILDSVRVRDKGIVEVIYVTVVPGTPSDRSGPDFITEPL